MDYMTLKEASEKWGVTPRMRRDRQTAVSKIQKNNPLVRFL